MTNLEVCRLSSSLSVMFVTVIATSVVLAFTRAVLAQGTSRAISEYSGHNCSYPYYMYDEELDVSFPYQGYYSVAVDFPGTFSQATCNSALNYVVTECNAKGEFRLTGWYETGGTTFAVICFAYISTYPDGATEVSKEEWAAADDTNAMNDYNIFLVKTTSWISWIVMFVTIIATSLVLAFTRTVLGQGVQCENDGYSACPYPQATNADLQDLISTFCGDNGGYPYYMYEEALDQSFLVQGYYEVTSDRPGGFSQATCNSALNYIVTECNARPEYWLTGSYETGGVTFSVTPCEPI
ncbi:hypothetical protein DACRYDRAFT_107495 [Dacryopinax primogenitus]|uniref:Uncharacterized protein n=1 Tax=Dacryopinax primogenitus (strain DJM 731) TaxID=1858805 RepID=M5G7E1_DACPD|nr:uncharacterized protein DACRYDRAFT_107495 [Dacryopinax primogenitus]EJU01757.1 hypothetical protein DACRYDRAFT_107495 [Dacryopinax primogenitus]